MNHGAEIRSLMTKAHQSHKKVNHYVQNMNIDLSADNISLTIECLDADGDMFSRTYATPINGSVSNAINILKNNF